MAAVILPRFLQHVREGLPYIVAGTALLTFQLDIWANKGRGLRLLQDYGADFQEATRQTATAAMKGPVHDLLQTASPQQVVMKQLSHERFLSMPMPEQLDKLATWLREGNRHQGQYFLSIFARDRGSPATDSVVSPLLRHPALVEELSAAHGAGTINSALFLGALSALSVHPGNAQQCAADGGRTVRRVLAALIDARESEAATVLGLRALCLFAIHAERPGHVERLLVESGAVPYLLSVLNEAPVNIFEARFPSQLLSSIVRSQPGALEEHMQGRYLDGDGDPLCLSTVAVLGLRTADARSKLPLYLRLAKDVAAAGGERGAADLRRAGLVGVALGVLRNEGSYTELVPDLCKLMRAATAAGEEPHQFLLHEGALDILSKTVRRAGRYSHDAVRDMEQTVELALADPRSQLLLQDKGRQGELENFRSVVTSQLGRPQELHVPQSWLDADAAQLRAVAVSTA